MVQASENVPTRIMKDEKSLPNRVDLKADNTEPCESSNKIKNAHQAMASNIGPTKAFLEPPQKDKHMAG